MGFRAQTNTHLTCTLACLPACPPACLVPVPQASRLSTTATTLPQYPLPQYRVACQEGLIACTAVTSANPIRPSARD